MALETKSVEINCLLFDTKNPRLPEDLNDQHKLFRFLVDDIGVEDLLNSMAASGMIEGDPIVVRPAEREGKFYVIEGNRRLAALKLLNGEKIKDGKPERAIPEITPDIAETLKKVRVQSGWDQNKLDAYLGYKHVTAAREWSPEAKAKFVLSRCKGNLNDENLSKFAKRLGTTLPTLRRWVVAYLALKQAQDAGKFDPAQAHAKRYFGTFYTLLGSQEVQEFLSLKSTPITRTPVAEDHLRHLGEFISWVIGTKKDPPVVNSRKQQELGAVLSSPNALQHFRAKRNLEAALLYTEFNTGQIAEKLLTAAYTIEECLPKIFDVKSDPQVISAIDNLDRAYRKLKLNTDSRPEETASAPKQKR